MNDNKAGGKSGGAEGHPISAKRRKRIERIKKMIRFGRFVRRNLIDIACVLAIIVSFFVLGRIYYQQWWERNHMEELRDRLITLRAEEADDDNTGEDSAKRTEQDTGNMLPEYAALYRQNPDMIGWLSISGTNIDYPVMQTPENEGYYLNLDFWKKESKNGCLILDTDSDVGSGTAAMKYVDGTKPSTNLIIHGHTRKSGEMFGKLNLYANEAYAKKHNIISFDSLYERRSYEVIAVFYSQVYTAKDKVFKYYQFFEAKDQVAFDDWYDNIKKLSLFDTGVTAEFGDEFITLSCCAYHVDNGRFVVVGKRVRS